MPVLAWAQMAPRPQWILADPHAGQEPEADAELVQTLHAAARFGADLLIMGDLFVAWLAPERFWSPRQRTILEAIQAVRAAGGRTRFVVGNRDYLVPDLQGTVFDAVYSAEVVTEVAGRPTLLSHGDGLNPEDRPYLAWRALSRSPLFTAGLRRLPPELGRALATRTEARMAGMNPQYKSGALPVALLESLGRRAAFRGAEQALVGHFHADQRVEVPGGVPVICVPGWCEKRHLLVGDPGGALRSVPARALWVDPDPPPSG